MTANRQTDRVPIERRLLEKVRISVENEVPRETLIDMTVECIEDRIVGRFRYQLRGYLWGERIGKQSCEWPADWWQHFKQRWFPRWALRRWPVMMARRDFVAKALYPDYKAFSPEQRIALAMMKAEDK